MKLKILSLIIFMFLTCCTPSDTDDDRFAVIVEPHMPTRTGYKNHEEDSTSVSGEETGEQWEKSDEERIYYSEYPEKLKDFSEAFESVDLNCNGTETEEGIFGVPIYLIVKNKSGLFLVVVNNTYGVFTICAAREHKCRVWYVSNEGNNCKGDRFCDREVYDPTLYKHLKNMGLNILSEKDLKEIYTRYDPQERQRFFRTYRPAPPRK